MGAPGRRDRGELAADALALFNALLWDTGDAGSWDEVELELVRCEDCSMVLVSRCRAHTVELLAFNDMDSVCVGVVYRGPASFARRAEGA